ncbi:MAG: UDP-N-acetylmuramate--L-alanine ligase [Firmicutes bacterium]|nr:UDP-N-acetylmuramate--L-alanine ligase [Bacillota bacterium]
MSFKGSVHFIAIGGIGMSALAKILLSMGYEVSGSDVQESAVVQALRGLGARIHIGHAAENVPENCGEIIYSTAIREDNPEVIRGREMGIPIVHRGELLARLFNSGRGLAVAGAHGKTTTSAMLALIYHLEQREPNIVLGGILPAIGSNALKGDSDIWVVEADESDGSFLKLNPHRTIVTNIEPEHMNYYKSEENLENAFYRFAEQSEDLILCLDDRRTRELAEKLDGKFHSYGLEHRAVDLTVKNIRQQGLSTFAEVYFMGEKVADLHLRVPGLHNISNALAAMYAAYLGGIPFANAAKALNEFTGTGRRFEILYDKDDVVIVDDYAHHPTEVKATIRAAKGGGFKRVVAVFQPHRYSRVLELYKEFGESFGDADVIIIDDIYSAWEDVIPDVTSELIVKEIEKQGLKPLYFGDKDKMVDYLLQETKAGDILLMMGAGNIRKTSEELRDRFLGE